MSLGLRSYNEAENIDFDDITIDLADFYLGARTKFRNNSYISTIYTDSRKKLPEVSGSGVWDLGFMKCFGLRSTLKNIQYVSFAFNSSLYPNGIRPSVNLHTVIGVHLPNQLSLVGNSFKYAWPKRNERREHTMEFSLQQIDILKRRNKRNDPCISDDFNFDQILWDDGLERIGCKTPYHRTHKNLKICYSKEKIEKAIFDNNNSEKPMKPCTSASTLTFAYSEYDLILNGPDRFYISFIYPKLYKEIKMIQAIELQTVIRNAGGYIGLFLGEIKLNLFELISIL